MGMPPTTAGAIDDMKKLKMGATPRDKSSLPYARAMLAGRKIFSETLLLVLPFFPPAFVMGTWPAILDSHWDLQDLHTFLGSKWSLDGHCATPKATLDGFAHPTTHHFGPWASEWYQPQKEHQPRPTHTVSHHQQGNFVRTRRVSITQKGVDDAPVRFFFPEEPFRRRENDRLSTPFSTTKAGKSEEPKGEGRSPPTGTATPTPTNARTQPPQATERGGGTAKPSQTKGAKKAPPSMTERPRGRTRTTVGAVRRWPPCSLLNSFSPQPASFARKKLAGRLGAVQSSFFRSPTGFHKEGPAQTSNQNPPGGAEQPRAPQFLGQPTPGTPARGLRRGCSGGAPN